MKIEDINDDQLALELKSILESKSPYSYIEKNSHWREFDFKIEQFDYSAVVESMHLGGQDKAELQERNGEEKSFIKWFAQSREVEMIKKVICRIIDELKKLIDEKAELKNIIRAGLGALAAYAGITDFSGLIVTVLVGLLAQAILNGLDGFCKGVDISGIPALA